MAVFPRRRQDPVRHFRSTSNKPCASTWTHVAPPSCKPDSLDARGEHFAAKPARTHPVSRASLNRKAMMAPRVVDTPAPRIHPRTLGWFGTTALAMGGSNQMIFLITALFVGQGDILGQGSAAVPLLIVGVLLSWAAAPAWTELVLMWPNRVGGIAAACAEAFRPYSPVLAALTGICYWWGWVPTCGLTALLSAAALQQWYFPNLPVEAVAIGIIGIFTAVNLFGVKWVARPALPMAVASASLAFLS